MTLKPCGACDNLEDPRFGIRLRGETDYVPLCDGCAPGPGDRPDYIAELTARIMAKRHTQASAPSGSAGAPGSTAQPGGGATTEKP